jgi:site-specific recombinase XerD
MFYKVLGVSKKTGEGTVYAVLRGKSETGEKSETVRTTGVTVNPKYFSTKSGKVTAKDLLHVEKNAKIQAIVTELEAAARYVNFQGLLPTRETVAAAIADEATALDTFAKLKEWRNKNLTDECHQLRIDIQELELQLEQKRKDLAAKEMKLGLIPKPLLLSVLFDNWKQLKSNGKHGKPLKKSTLKNMDVLKNIVLRFRSQAVLTDINLDFFVDLQAHLVGRGVTNKTILEVIGKFKTFYRYWAAKNDISASFLIDFETVEDGEANDTLFLNAEQLAELEALPLQGRAQIDVRRQFLFAVETGLRRSDYQIKSSDIVGSELRLPNTKTGKLLAIPFTKKARQLFNAANQNFRLISEAQFNQTLRNICKKMSTMQETTRVFTYVGNKTISNDYPFYQLMTSHVARKTFAHNALSKGATMLAVAEWLGHKSTKMLEAYYTNKKELARQEAHLLLSPPTAEN